MKGFVSLLLYAALFYLMMRFGCGAHMIHGSHGSHGRGEHEGPEAGSAKDPVCGMQVEPGQAYSEVYQGKQYRFCSRNCLDTFDAEPRRYAA